MMLKSEQHTTIDRGSLGVTRIGPQAKLDNLVHVAHNVEIGERTIIAAQTGVAGSSLIGSDVLIGGQVGIADHCRLENGSVAGAQCGIPTGKVIRRGQTVWGTPARADQKALSRSAINMAGWPGFRNLPSASARLRPLPAKQPLKTKSQLRPQKARLGGRPRTVDS